MIDLTRRSLLASLAASAPAALVPVWSASAQAPQKKVAEKVPAFGFEDVLKRARAVALNDYDGSFAPLPEDLARLDFDRWREIRFPAEKALLGDAGGQFRLQLFHLGHLFHRPITIHLINEGVSEPLLNVARLFDDYKGEEERYFKKTGIVPIMHVMAIKRQIVRDNPWLPVNIFKAFEKAKGLAMQRMFNPRIVPLVWYRHAWDEQQKLFGNDPWEYGLTDKNRHTLDTLVGYSYEQGMMKRRWPLDELFLNVSQGRKRGGFRV